MIDFLRNWVLNIVTLVIFIVLIEIMLPSGRVKKFINLVSGFILIIAIINPFLGLINKNVNLAELQVTSSNLLDRSEIEADSKILKEDQMKQTVELYKEKIISQAEESAREVKGVADAKADVIINEDYTSDTFGEIKRIFLSLRMDDVNQGVKPVSRIEKVEVSGSKGASDKESGVDKGVVSNAISDELETKINKLLDVQKDKVVISLQK